MSNNAQMTPEQNDAWIRSPLSLAGRVAIVTGAGSQGPGWGNGKAIAVTLARAGAIVLCVDRIADAAAETVRLVEAEGGRADVAVGDCTAEADVAAIVYDCVAKFGRIDVLVNNVGLSLPCDPATTPLATWDAQFEVNMKSAFLWCRAVLPIMERQSSGSIVSIASTAAIRYTGKPQAAYAAAKAGLVQFSRVVAVQYAQRGVRLNCVLPGLIETPLVEKLAADFASDETGSSREEFFTRRRRQVPMGRMGEAFDVANAVLFLASDASKYITGTQIIVDGGLTAAVRS